VSSLEVVSGEACLDVLLVTLEPSDCHRNVARLYAEGWTPDGMHRVSGFGLGFALSPDGLWRQHSWALSSAPGGWVVETTVARVAYAGLPLAGDAAAVLSTALLGFPPASCSVAAGPVTVYMSAAATA
jgi:hypothetical protein